MRNKNKIVIWIVCRKEKINVLLKQLFEEYVDYSFKLVHKYLL